ncbi:MAG: nuclear transport factor 2 family protein [Actinomycetes bacterium]
MNEGPLSTALREYVDRVVNRRDVTGVDDLVSPAYRGSGSGWPEDRTALRAFYEMQYRDRPDWHIDLQETCEVGPSVVARALAGGTVSVDGQRRRRRVEWLTHYRFEDGRICATNVLDVVQHADAD